MKNSLYISNKNFKPIIKFICSLFFIIFYFKPFLSSHMFKIDDFFGNKINFIIKKIYYLFIIYNKNKNKIK